MDSAKEMYKEMILDLFKHPNNFGVLKSATHQGSKNNPTCGDQFTIQINVKKGIIEDVKFQGAGCAISTAAASLLTDKVKGMSTKHASQLKLNDMLEMLGIPISANRLSCATLALEALQLALNNSVKNQ